jgi:hypothetical protein
VEREGLKRVSFGCAVHGILVQLLLLGVDQGPPAVIDAPISAGCEGVDPCQIHQDGLRSQMVNGQVSRPLEAASQRYLSAAGNPKTLEHTL